MTDKTEEIFAKVFEIARGLCIESNVGVVYEELAKAGHRDAALLKKMEERFPTLVLTARQEVEAAGSS